MDGTLWIDVTVAEQVRAILALHVQRHVQDLTMSDKIADLGLDSLGVVELIFALEEAFEISVPFNANDPSQSRFDISTVGAVIAGVEALIAAR